MTVSTTYSLLLTKYLSLANKSVMTKYGRISWFFCLYFVNFSVKNEIKCKYISHVSRASSLRYFCFFETFEHDISEFEVQNWYSYKWYQYLWLPVPEPVHGQLVLLQVVPVPVATSTGTSTWPTGTATSGTSTCGYHYRNQYTANMTRYTFYKRLASTN